MEAVIYFLKKYKLIIISSLIVLILSLIFIFNSNDKEAEIEVVTNQLVEEEIISDTIKVNIKGAVIAPGVYEVESDSRVEDVINKAGGLTEDGDTSIINLSKRLNDESVIIIYTKDEVKKIKKGNVVIQYIENECNCPEYENSACIDPDTLVNNEEDEVNNGKISLNKASIDELQTLSGIGESKAKSIIEYRNNNGGFKSIEEIKNVKGIGDAVFNKIKDNITV